MSIKNDTKIERNEVRLSKKSENYFKRVNKEALEAFEKGEFKGDNLSKIADRNKEDFFEMVKDFFKDPLEGLKWFGTKLFGETFLKWNNEVKKSYQSVENAKNTVVETAESSYKKAKNVLESVPKKIKSLSVVGGVYEAGEKVVDYLSNNPEEARKMPEGERAQVKWWQEIFLAAGVKPESAEGKSFLSLVTDGSTWEEIGENVKEKATNEKGYAKLKEEVESGQFDKMQPFTGEKIGKVAEKIVAKLDLIKDDFLRLIKNNPNVAATMSVYLGYNIGLKKNGFRVAADFGKIIMKLAASPLILVNNNKIKTMLAILGGVLIKDQTKWDETIALRLKETRLPEDYQEFKDYLDANQELNEAKALLASSQKELQEALGVFKNPTLLDNSFEVILDTLTSPSQIAGGMMNYVANSPEENMAIANQTGFYKIQSLIANDNFLANRLSEEKFAELNNEINSIGEELTGEENSNIILGIDFEKLERINEEYGIVGEFRFEEYGPYIRYSKIDMENGGIVLDSYNMGLRKDISEEERIDAARRFNIDENFTIEFFKNLDTAGSIPESTVRMYREMLGSLADTLSDTSSVEKMNQGLAENIEKGKYPMISDGRNFFIYYGGQYFPMTLGAGVDVLKYVTGGSEVEAKDVAVSYGEGLAMYTVVASSKAGFNLGADVFYKLMTGMDRRLLASKGKRLGWSVVKGAGYPVTVAYNGLSSIGNGIKNFRREGWKGLLKMDTAGELKAAMKSMKYRNLARITSKSDDILKVGKDVLLGSDINKKSNAYRKLSRINDLKMKVGNVLRTQGVLKDASMIEQLRKEVNMLDQTGELWKKIGIVEADPDNIDKKTLQRLLDVLDGQEKTITNLLDGVDNGALSRFARSSATSIGAGARNLGGSSMRALGRAGNKLIRNKKTAVVGAVALGTYGLSEYISEDEENISGADLDKNESKEVHEKNKKMLAKAILGMNGEFTQKFMSDEYKEKLAGMGENELSQEIGKMATWYENAHNDLMMELWRNNESYKGNLAEIQTYISEEMTKHGVKNGLEITDTSNWYELDEKQGFYLMNGLMSLAQNKDGEIVLGWASRPNVINKFTRLAWEAKEGTFTSVGKDITPVLGVERSFERAGKFYVQGNNEEMLREMSEGVSNFALDTLGFISLGGSKTIQGLFKSKKAVKTVEHMSALESASRSMGKNSDLAFRAYLGSAALSTGAAFLKDEIDTYKIIKND